MSDAVWTGAYALPAEDSADVLADVRAGLAATQRGRIRTKVIDAWGNDAEGARPSSWINEETERRLATILRRGTAEGWSTIRARVFARDRAICHVCGQAVAADDYECGHIIDRCADGTDRDSNLVVMHVLCNRMKPVHVTRAEYLAWLSESPIHALARRALGGQGS